MSPRRDEADEAQEALLQNQSPIAPFDEVSATTPTKSHRGLLSTRLVLPLALGLALTLVGCFVVTRAFFPRTPTYRDTFHLPPEFPLDPSKSLVVEAVGNHSVTAILLHGLTDETHTLPFRNVLPESSYPFIKWVSPQAPHINSTVNGGAWKTAWYNIETFADLHQNEDEMRLIRSTRQINQLIEEERRILIEQGKEPRIVIAGFSQGGVMSLLTVLSSIHKLEAAIVLSGYLALPDKVELLAADAPRDMPIWWGHGLADPYLTEEHAAVDVETLRQPPFSFTNLAFRTYERVEHYYNEAEMQDMVDWWVKHVPEGR